MPRQDLIQVRRGTAAQWTSANPTLDSGEFGFETDTNKLKCGDGSTAWNDLSYISGSGGAGDMLQSVYDPTNVEDDAFDMENMVEGTTNKIFTATERTTLNKATLNDDTDVSGNDWVIDEDDMSSDSDEKVPTQQSVKAYVDANVGGAFEFQTEITATTTTFDGSQKGLNKVYPQNNASASTITIENGDYVENDVINIERRGQGTLEIVQNTDVRFRGVRDIDNRFFINDANSMVSLICRGNDGTNDVFSIIGNLKRGYTGAVTTSAYGTIESSETKDVAVVGTGFSDNMLVSLTGNATLNSWTYVDNNNITLNITSSGSDGDFLTVTYDNGDIFVDTNAIQLTDTAALSIVLETTSTSSTWSPQTVNNSGDTLRWTVSGDASGVYDANDPTIDLSGNTGTAIITITSNDDLAGLTTCRFSSLAITSADVSDWTACTELWFFGNSLTEIVGTENLTNATTFDLRNNGMSTINVTGLTGLNKLHCYGGGSALSTITGLSDCTGLTNLGLTLDSQASIDLSFNTGLTDLLLAGSSNLNTITGLSTLTSLEFLNVSNCNFTTIDIDSNNSLNTLFVQTNSLTVSTINNIILDLDDSGVSNGNLNYSSQSPTANPTATENTTDDVLDAYNNLVSNGWTITGATPA